uniref:Cytokine like 1 n=1 Tax=Oryzias latipes TaxID=8090 RepID=A0A3P9KS49_ORYLA
MRPGLVVLLFVFSCALRSECAPPTCYSRALELSREIMTLLDRVHTSHRTKTCAEVLPTIFIDVHVSLRVCAWREIIFLISDWLCSVRTLTEVIDAGSASLQNACITNKLRDFLYVVLNHPSQSCREKPRMKVLKGKIQNLYNIITRICYRDLVFFTDDCEAIDTGHSRPYVAEDRLQILQEER